MSYFFFLSFSSVKEKKWEIFMIVRFFYLFLFVSSTFQLVLSVCFFVYFKNVYANILWHFEFLPKHKTFLKKKEKKHSSLRKVERKQKCIWITVIILIELCYRYVLFTQNVIKILFFTFSKIFCFFFFYR